MRIVERMSSTNTFTKQKTALNKFLATQPSGVDVSDLQRLRNSMGAWDKSRMNKLRVEELVKSGLTPEKANAKVAEEKEAGKILAEKTKQDLENLIRKTALLKPITEAAAVARAKSGTSGGRRKKTHRKHKKHARRTRRHR